MLCGRGFATTTGKLRELGRLKPMPAATRAQQWAQRDPAALPTSTLTAPFTQVSLPARFTNPGPNAAQRLPAALFAGGSRSSEGAPVIQLQVIGRIGQGR